MAGHERRAVPLPHTPGLEIAGVVVSRGASAGGLAHALFSGKPRNVATETSGRGVSLAVAATLQSLDGRVDVTTSPQEGTQFRVSRPYVDTEHARRNFPRSQVIPQD